jgi:hypothetical protein
MPDLPLNPRIDCGPLGQASADQVIGTREVFRVQSKSIVGLIVQEQRVLPLETEPLLLHVNAGFAQCGVDSREICCS